MTEWREKAKSDLKTWNFRSKARETGKEVYEAFEQGDKEKAHKITLEFLSDWASYFADGYTSDITIKTEDREVHYTLYKKESLNPNRVGSDWEWQKVESSSFTGGDVPEVVDELYAYWNGEEPDPHYREEVVPSEYIEDMNKRHFKNIYRNIMRDRLMTILSEIFNDLSREQAFV